MLMLIISYDKSCTSCGCDTMCLLHLQGHSWRSGSSNSITQPHREEDNISMRWHCDTSHHWHAWPASTWYHLTCPNIGPTPPTWKNNHCSVTERPAASFGRNLPMQHEAILSHVTVYACINDNLYHERMYTVPYFSAKYTKIAPDSKTLNGFPSGPLRSVITGILELGLSSINQGSIIEAI